MTSVGHRRKPQGGDRSQQRWRDGRWHQMSRSPLTEQRLVAPSAAWSWKPRTRHCGGRRGGGQRLCEMVARGIGLCAAGSRWRGRRASASLGVSRTTAHGDLARSGAFWPWSPFRTDSRRSTLVAGTGLYAPFRTLDLDRREFGSS
jgi:hypothetical protein